MGLVLNDRISYYGLFWVIYLLYGCGGHDERVNQQRYSFLVLLLSERKHVCFVSYVGSWFQHHLMNKSILIEK